jgi:hypothetical protein
VRNEAILEDLMDILTPEEALKAICHTLEHDLPSQDIAYTIFEMKGICPFCLDKGPLGKGPCPVCFPGTDNRVRYQMNKTLRHEAILKSLPDVWVHMINTGVGTA